MPQTDYPRDLAGFRRGGEAKLRDPSGKPVRVTMAQRAGRREPVLEDAQRVEGARKGTFHLVVCRQSGIAGLCSRVWQTSESPIE